MRTLKQMFRSLALRILTQMGTELVDQRTGTSLGKALVLGWRGKIVIIGLSAEEPVIPTFLPQQRLTYWKQELGLSSYPLPDAHLEERP